MTPADAERSADRGRGDEFVGGFVEAVLAVVADIPPGRVATYGDVATLLGSRGARAVGQTMARYGADVPWWRVVRAGGRPPAGHAERARAHYEREGTPLLAADNDDGYRIDLAACRWRP
ncbi:DNA-binding protein [Agromyces protaetiae]|uniref:DNA-binding protein n=1 Tax=Agromyces protaetiae TaxID=2509455 RepID=A0A4P6FBN8_9MICO|nr:MGMT family protein [Agromyces protaetiae]QAY73244.1 DNA-binding protein [Agromyces protaetiae]